MKWHQMAYGVKIINNNQWRNIEMKWRNHQNESNNGGENNEIIINNQRVISMKYQRESNNINNHQYRNGSK
jgi:hypothetical protein